MHVSNRRCIRAAHLPVLPAEELATELEVRTRDGWRIVALFGTPETPALLRLVAVMARDDAGELAVSSSVVGQRYPALSRRSRQATRFEREIVEQCGALPDGVAAPAVRRHAPDHAPVEWSMAHPDRDAYSFATVSGEDVHEVAVGPVHAGVIEPGHFRFQAHGEEVLALEIMLGYQHRGVERLLETSDRHRATLVAESIAGDTVIGHASAACGAIEALARSRKTPRGQAIRGIALEVERLANHIGDLGALAGDVAFHPASAYLGRLRGECLNLLMTVSGNRYGRGLIRPGGVAFDIPDAMASEIAARVSQLREELAPVLTLLFDASSVQSRFEAVGIVTREQVLANGYVGLVARSCEVPRDVRHDFAYGVYRFAQIPVAQTWAGDVQARALVRRLEIQRSIEFVTEQVSALPRGAVRVDCGPLQPSELVVALEEGWRGEIAHVVMTDADGRVRRHKVVDPSFHNWPALAGAMSGNLISDFPLCNKSFNLSYAGHDL
jgi:Ni,Fe-hydrogenase III large subunit